MLSEPVERQLAFVPGVEIEIGKSGRIDQSHEKYSLRKVFESEGGRQFPEPLEVKKSLSAWVVFCEAEPVAGLCFVVAYVVEELAHHENAEPALLAVLDMLLQVGRSEPVGVEVGALVRQVDREGIATDDCLHRNVATLVAVGMFDDIGGGFVDGEFKSVDQLVTVAVLLPDLNDELAQIGQVVDVSRND